ncbi:MAG: energy-coupling factor transporter ATPase [Clostridia bacterium]|nr:energy-coupling factor transporter ATPase [Clostridia bacterium]
MEVIKFENVYYSYDRETVEQEELFDLHDSFALRGVDFSVKEGEFVAILGHNGSGKSTLARLVNGLLSPTSGKITVFGMDACERRNLFEIRKQVGIVFQNPDNQTVASIVEDDIAFGPENIGIEREEIGRRIEFALRSVGMEDFRNGTPNRLSGGQKQRIAIAGVLALKPRVMILDESTAMLDPRGRKEVMEVVKRLNREEKITVILITHFPEEALLADRAVVMHQGKIVLEGAPKEVFQKQDILERFSLVTPRPVRLCRALTKGGLPVADSMDPMEVAVGISNAIERVEPSQILQTKGAGLRSRTNTKENSETGGVLCQDLSHVYNIKSPFETQALEGVNLEINSGEFFGIIGHTGSGKSTFVQYLNGLLKVPSAEKKYKEKKSKKGLLPKPILKVNGFDLTDKHTDFRNLRSKVGMVFQYPEYQLFAETVWEDVAFGLKNFRPESTPLEVKEAVKEAIQTVGLSYEEVKGRSPFELSGGQRRRVAIAGVLVTKPEILVLDEPAAGLDPLGKEEIMSLLHKIHNDWCKTIIIVSHDMDEIVENCTRAAVFSEGKVLVTGTPEEVFSQAELLYEKGLDIPFVAKVCAQLRAKGIEISCDLTLEDFTEKLFDFAKNKGAGMRLRSEGGQNHA